MGLLDLLGGDAMEKLQGMLGKVDAGNHSEADAHDLHEQVVAHASEDDYRQAAHDALDDMTPEQQQQVYAHLQEQLAAQGHDAAQLHGEEHAPGSQGGLADVLTQVLHKGRDGGGQVAAAPSGGGGGGGGLLGGLGGLGSLMKNPMVAILVGVIGAKLAKKMM